MAGPARVPASHSPSIHLPYTDPNQAGLLTLCDVALQPITHGLITTKPFVWRVVSDVPAPRGYFARGAKAALFAYQPRPFTPAGAWSGIGLAPATYYSNRLHPMAQFTPIDSALTQMTLQFPPIWHHLLELRLYLARPGVPELTRGYAAADIQVTGNTWTLVEGGHASCTSGRAVAEEVLLHMPGASGTPKPAAGGSGPNASSGPSSGASGGPASSPLPGGSAAPVAATRSSGTGAALAALGIVALAAVAVVSGGLIWRRKRRATG
jgi:hypothetical protein